ncbi:hypothetical protein VE04_08453 [Pseudogymnoascus sp. 24MN13]|nr:hypothetical protein VE04_08453 [Pseudogymnoascus sp. 24MN13]
MIYNSFLKIFITVGLSVLPAAGQAVPPVTTEKGVSAYAFDLSQVTLSSGRWLDNQKRTESYLKDIDIERLLYNYRITHKLSTNGAATNGGWDAPDFPFRTHMQGHFLTAWSQCYAVNNDISCRERAIDFVAELAKCQANNNAAGFSTGYLSGFPESEFVALEAGTLSNGNVPYYVVHKLMAGLLDVWRIIGDTKARDMQNMLATEFGGMNEVLADIYHQTGTTRWLTAAQRFDHAAVFNPLALNQDSLNGLHANTQVPKWIGAAREFKATGTTRYRDIAQNAWDITVNTHSYAIGGNSQAEHFHAPNAIASYLNQDTCEACNTYNMLKLTRELWVMNPSSVSYFDYYELALMNHLIGQQNPADSHGHITYFTPLNPGGRRGVGPAWGGGTWSTDYDSFWCCQGTGVETNTKLMDSIYFYDRSSLYVNLFAPSVLKWTQRGLTVTQATTYPVTDTTTLVVTGTSSSNWAMRIRIPQWASGAEVSVNGQKQSISTASGTYAVLSRSWKSGDTVTIRLPMKLRTVPAKDNANIAAIAYGPVILSGNYGSTSLSSVPTLTLGSIKRSSQLAFTATANGQTVNLSPFYDAHGYNYNVYWAISGQLPTV